MDRKQKLDQQQAPLLGQPERKAAIARLLDLFLCQLPAHHVGVEGDVAKMVMEGKGSVNIVLDNEPIAAADAGNEVQVKYIKSAKYSNNY